MCDPLLLTVEQAAERLGFGRSFTYEFIRKGRLPSIKVGGARRVLATDLIEFVQRMKAEAEDDAV